MIVVELPHQAAAGDTWGISGPRFLAWYIVALFVALVIALIVRERTGRTVSTDSPGDLPAPAEIAYLTRGRIDAVLTALAALRAAGVVE